MSAVVPTITTSTRAVTNKDTGLDLYVHGERQSVISKRTSKPTVYNVIVVSNLPIFYATNGNTSQYALEKSHDDLQRLNKKLCKRFSGTLIPEVSKKPVSIIDNPAKARERIKQCESFLQFCAKTPKIANSEELLQFLAIGNPKTSSPEDVEQVQKNDQNEQVESKDRRSMKPKLFKDAIAITDGQIFDSDDCDDELPAYIGPCLKPENDSNIHLSQPSARLYKEHSPHNASWTVRPRRNDNAIADEYPTLGDESGDDDFENLMRRLDGARLDRQNREKERSAKEIAASHSQGDSVSNTDDHAVTEVRDFALDDISKYINENSRSTLDFDLDL